MFKKLTPLIFLIAGFGSAICAAQTPSPADASRGFISPTAYTNAYFGFQLPLFPELRSKGPSLGPLFFLYSGLGIENNSIETLMVRLATDHKHSGKKEVLAGRTFYVERDKKNASEGTLYSAVYETDLGPYMLQVMVGSFSKDGFARLSGCVEGITFFDPAKAQEQAGTNAVAVARQPPSPK